MTWKGRALRRFEDPALLRGDGRFVSDLARGAACVRFVRSPVARGRITAIEVPDGVQAFTANDLEGVKPIRTVIHKPDFRPVVQPLLATGRVTFVGEPIAAVVGSTAEEAEDLEEQVFVEFETEETIVDVADAIAPGAKAVHPDAPTNVLIEGVLRTPGVDETFAKAAQIVELELVSKRQSAVPMEPRGGFADFDRATERVTLYASVQNPHIIRTGIADCLGIPEADLRVVAPDVGGGFGQKMCLAPEYAMLVWLARRLHRPLAWIEDRRENFMASAHARDIEIVLRAAFDKDARLLAIDGDVRCNVGAYHTYPLSCSVEPMIALSELPGPYDFREYAVRTRGIATNTCPMAPYRGVSRPVITLAMERMMDTAAYRFGLDPVEIRRRNLVKTFPYVSVTGLVYDEGSYLEAMERAATLVDLEAFRLRQAHARVEGRHIGIGFSVFSERSGYGTPVFAARKMEIVPGYETVELSMDPSGFVVARIGSSPHGQGLATSLRQVIADELGIDPSKIRIVHGDTDATPYGWGTYASRGMVISGGACMLASMALGKKIKLIASEILEARAEDIELVDGQAKISGTDRSIDIAAVARFAHHQAPRLLGKANPGLTESATYDPAGTFSNACHVAIVDVDTEIGRVRVDRFVVVEDAGLLVNPLIVDGQVHGGVAQGIANALYEEIKYDEHGNLLTASFADYLVPTILEVPDIEIEHLVTTTDASITKAKGIGEGGAIGAPAAVINAIVDALRPLGVEINEMPVSSKRIRDLIRQSRERSQ
jgi:carbon-monoxide dehydrogenase large subunit